MSTVVIFLAYISKILLFFAVTIALLLWQVKKGQQATFGQLFFLLLGMIVVLTTGYAVLATRLLTVQLIYVLILGLGAKKLWKEWKENQKSSTSRPILLIGSVVAILHSFLWAFMGRVRAGDFPFVIPVGTDRAGNDIHFYSFISHYLPISHQENYFHVYNVLDPNFHGVKPYHYLELWLSSFFTEVIGGMTVLNLTLVVYPLLYALAFIGFLAMWERFVQVKWYHILITIAFFYTAGTFNEWYKDLKLHDFSLPIHSWRYKMSVYYVFIIGGILALLQGKHLTSLIVLLCLPVATVVATPVMCATIMIWILLPTKIQGLNWGSRWLIIGLMALMGSFLLIFYSQFGGQAESTLDADNQLLAPLKQLLVPKVLLAKLTFTVKGVLEILALYAPYVLMAGLFIWKMPREYKQALGKVGLLLALVVVMGSACWTVLFHLIDAAQLHFNLAIPFANVSAFLLIMLIIASYEHRHISFSWINIGKGILTASIFIYLLHFSYQKVHKRHIQPRNKQAYSQEYLAEIKQYLESGQASEIGGAIKGGRDYQSIYGRRPSTYVLGYYLAYMKEGYTCVSLSDFDIPVGKNKPNLIRKDIASGIFYQFVQRQKEEGGFVSVEQSQLDFIKYHGINFIVVSKAARLPAGLEDRVDRKLVDKRSKEKFFILSADAP